MSSEKKVNHETVDFESTHLTPVITNTLRDPQAKAACCFQTTVLSYEDSGQLFFLKKLKCNERDKNKSISSYKTA